MTDRTTADVLDIREWLVEKFDEFDLMCYR